MGVVVGFWMTRFGGGVWDAVDLEVGAGVEDEEETVLGCGCLEVGVVVSGSLGGELSVAGHLTGDVGVGWGMED